MFTKYKKKEPLEKGRTWVGIDNDAVLGRHGNGEWWLQKCGVMEGYSASFLEQNKKKKV